MKIAELLLVIKRSDRISIHHAIFFISLVFIAVTLPLSVSACSVSIIILTLNWIVEGGFRKKFDVLFHNSWPLLFMSLYVLHIIGMLYTSDIPEGLIEVEKKLSLFVFPLVLATSSQLTEKYFQKVLWAFILSCCLAVLISLFSIWEIYQSTGLFFLPTQLHSNLMIHYPYFGMYIIIVFIFIAYLYTYQINKINTNMKIGLWIMAIIMIVFLLLLAARTALITFFILGMSNILYYILKRYKLIYGIITAGIGVLGFILIVTYVPQIRVRLEDVWVSFKIKMASWNCSLKIMREDYNFIWGVGTGDSVDKLQECYLKDIEWLAKDRVNVYLNVHNQYLELGLSLGLIGIICFLLGLLKPLIWSIKIRHFLYINFLACIIISISTESMLNAQKGIVCYAFFNSLFAFHTIKNKNTY